MRLSITSFLLPTIVEPDPMASQTRLVALIAECGDMGQAISRLIAESKISQRKHDQLYLDQAAKDMNEAVDEMRREHDWMSIGTAAKLIRMRRSTLHSAVMRKELFHKIIVVHGVSARHVRRCDVLDWHESRERSLRITAGPPSSAV